MIEKKYLKSKPICKVKFILPAESVTSGKTVAVVGDFNDWDTTVNPMKKQKTGVYACTLDLDVNQEYQFRYLVNGEIWLNDADADGYAPSNVSMEQNGLVSV